LKQLDIAQQNLESCNSKDKHQFIYAEKGCKLKHVMKRPETAQLINYLSSSTSSLALLPLELLHVELKFFSFQDVSGREKNGEITK
jgi:hypothetical protein